MTDAAILEDIGPLLTELKSLGFTQTSSQYSAACFGDYVVSLSSLRSEFRLTRDRGQYNLIGDDAKAKAMKLFRAFNDRDDFREAVLAYARAIV